MRQRLSCSSRRRALHACLAASLPAPLGYSGRWCGRSPPLAYIRRLAGALSTPLLQLHGRQDGCMVALTGDDA
jgi:hypothetical protein